MLKAATTACTVGSGGSGGLFGPSIVIGGCLGGAVGLLLHGLPIGPPPAACVLMGMSGVLAATHRTPVAALLMVSEIAGTWLLLLPAMWVSGLSFLLVGRRSLIGGQVDGVADSSAHRSHLFTDLLAQARVSDAIDASRRWTSFTADQRIADLQRAVQAVHQDLFPVIDADGRLLGVIDRTDLVQLDPQHQATAATLAGGRLLALRVDDPMTQAIQQFRQERVEELPVMDVSGRYLGRLAATQVMEFYRRETDRRMEERLADGYGSQVPIRQACASPMP